MKTNGSSELLTDIPVGAANPMRLGRADLQKITHRARPKHQAAWFREYLDIEIPHDRAGPILTWKTYEALLAKRLGVFPQTSPQIQDKVIIHLPTPRPVKPKLASLSTLK